MTKDSETARRGKPMLDQLKALEAAATPGPWPVGFIFWSLRQVEKSCNDTVYSHMDGAELSDDESGRCPSKTDAPLIAAARNALPDLIAVAEAANRLRSACDVYGGNPNLVGALVDSLDEALARLEANQ